MKISVNWLKQFTDIDISVDELVQKIGAQLGAVEEVIDLGRKYQGIVIARVVSCEKHPNADKLSVCLVDDGGKTPDVSRDENGYVQVVCGASNVRAGLKVVWLPPGATVPSTFDKDPFVLGARELRGVVSNGMLASASELAISDDHSGIVELEQDAVPGTDFAEKFGLNDYIIDVENKMFTHRPDCFGILGVAREIAGIQGKKFISPEWYLQGQLEVGGGPLQVAVQTALVPRFMAVRIDNVTVSSSPMWLQAELARVGLKSINNIVDITNYLAYVTAQPLHAYDADKLPKANCLEARMSRKGDKLLLLSGKELELQDDTTVLIASGDIPVGIGGVMGGKDTEVDVTTKNIIIECASFDMYNIRRTSMRYGLFTDAVTRFNKGQSSLQNMAVIARAVRMAQDLAGGVLAGGAVDAQKIVQAVGNVRLTSDFINARLGLQLGNEQIAEILENVEFDVIIDNNELVVAAPFWRTDIEIAEDVVEEVGRLYGFQHLPLQLPQRSIRPVQRDGMLQLKASIREVLSSAGANEVLTYSFVHGNLLERSGQNIEQAFKLSNALSPDLQYYRLSLTPSLLEKVHPNSKADYDLFALFEIGKVHGKGLLDDDGVPRELDRLAFVYAASKATDEHGAAYYWAKKYLDHLLGDYDNVGVQLVPLAQADFGGHVMIEQMARPFEPIRSAALVKDGLVMGVIGEYRADSARSLKLPQHTAGFEVFLRLVQLCGRDAPYRQISKYPKVSQDISLRLTHDVPFGAVEKELQRGLAELTGEDMYTELIPIDIYQKDDTKHLTFRLTVAHANKTLKAAEIHGLLDELSARTKQSLGAERI